MLVTGDGQRADQSACDSRGSGTHTLRMDLNPSLVSLVRKGVKGFAEWGPSHSEALDRSLRRVPARLFTVHKHSGLADMRSTLRLIYMG